MSAATNMTEVNLSHCHYKSKRIYLAEHSVLLTDDAKRQIAFHVRACLHRGRELSEALGQIHRSWGFRDQVTHFATQKFNLGL